jgi:hypothetical protein
VTPGSVAPVIPYRDASRALPSSKARTNRIPANSMIAPSIAMKIGARNANSIKAVPRSPSACRQRNRVATWAGSWRSSGGPRML